MQSASYRELYVFLDMLLDLSVFLDQCLDNGALLCAKRSKRNCSHPQPLGVARSMATGSATCFNHVLNFSLLSIWSASPFPFNNVMIFAALLQLLMEISRWSQVQLCIGLQSQRESHALARMRGS